MSDKPFGPPDWMEFGATPAEMISLHFDRMAYLAARVRQALPDGASAAATAVAIAAFLRGTGRAEDRETADRVDAEADEWTGRLLDSTAGLRDDAKRSAARMVALAAHFGVEVPDDVRWLYEEF